MKQKGMANMAKRVGGLEINENLKFQHRDWAAQRVGWVVMAVVVIAALLGFFGGTGSLRAEAKGSSEDTAVSYERFLRFMKPTTLEIQAGEEAGKEGKVSVWLDRRYLDGLQIQQITPQPSSAKSGPERLTYVFEVDDPNGPMVVSFDLQPQQKFGALRGRVGIGDGEPVRFGQFIYP